MFVQGTETMSTALWQLKNEKELSALGQQVIRSLMYFVMKLLNKFHVIFNTYFPFLNG
jgi:hypothetical protein